MPLSPGASGEVIIGGVAPQEPMEPPPPAHGQSPVPGPQASQVPQAIEPQPVAVENPFIPKALGVSSTNTQVNKPQPRFSAKKILIYLVIIFGIVLLGGGGIVVWQKIAAPKQVLLTYWGLWENDGAINSTILAYQAKNPAIKITYIKQAPQQYRKRLQAAIERGDGPDLFRFHNTWVPMLRNELSVAPKTIITATEFNSTFYKVAANDLVAGQSIYGIPIAIDGLGLYYNEGLFAAAGVTPPTTWEELLNIVPKLTVKTDKSIVTSAIALGVSNNVEHYSDILATMFLQNGAKLTNPVGKEAEETLIFFRKFANPGDPVYTWNETLDNSIYAFANGKVAMIFAPSWRAFDIKQMNPNLRFKIAPIPQLPGNTVTWASYWVEGVSAKSKHQLEVWQFLKYLSSREVEIKLYSEEAKSRLFGEPHSRVDLASTIADDVYAGAFVKQAQYARSFPLASKTSDEGLNDGLIKYLEDAVNAVARGTAPSSALDTMASGFRQVLSRYGLITSGTAPQSQ